MSYVIRLLRDLDGKDVVVDLPPMKRADAGNLVGYMMDARKIYQVDYMILEPKGEPVTLRMLSTPDAEFLGRMFRK